MTRTEYPRGWDEARVQQVLDHYETQTEAEAAAEDESAWRDPGHTTLQLPRELLQHVRELIAKHSGRGKGV